MTTFKDAEKKKPASNTVVRALRVVRVIYELDSAALPVEFMRALTTVGIPYLNIAFLGLVLNQLQQRASLQQVMLLISIFLAVRFLLQLCGGWFNKRAEDHETAVKRRLDRAVTEKLLTVSYSTLQDPDMRKAYAGAQAGQSFSGGLSTLMKEGLQDFFSLIIAVGFGIATLVSLMKPMAASSAWLNDDRYPLMILALLILPIVVGSWSIKHSNRIQQGVIQKIIPSNRRFTYFFNFTENMDNHQVVRLYRASDLIMHRETNSTMASLQQIWDGDWQMAKYGHWPNLAIAVAVIGLYIFCLLYTSPSPRD